MSLRAKLLLTAPSPLALPLGAWLLLRQLEAPLRPGQEQPRIAAARAIGRSLTSIESGLPPPGAALYVHAAPGRIAVDGFGDDWTALLAFAQSVGVPSDAQKVK